MSTDTFRIVMADGRRFERQCTEGEATATFESMTGAVMLLDSARNLIAGDYRAWLAMPQH